MNPLKKQLSFALPIVILIVAILIAAGGAGYYFYLSCGEVLRDKTPPEQEEVEVSKPKQIIDEIANWKTYRNEKYGFEVKYPSYFRLEYITILGDPELKKIEGLNKGLPSFKGVPEDDELYIHVTAFNSLLETSDEPTVFTKKDAQEERQKLEQSVIGAPWQFRSEKPYGKVIGISGRKAAQCLKFSPQWGGYNAYFITYNNDGDKIILNVYLKSLTKEEAGKETRNVIFNQILSTFKFIEIEKVEEEAPKVEEVPQVEEKPIAPSTPALKAPVLTDPGISVKKHEAFTLNWTSVKGAKRYWLQRDTSTNFSIPAWYCETNSNTDNPGIGTSAPEVTTTYYYRVKACDDQGCGAWSNVVDMEVIVPIPSITVTSPNGGEKWIIGKTYDIKWSSISLDKVTIDLFAYNSEGQVIKGFQYFIAKSIDATKGYYSWTIPEIGNYPNYKLRIYNKLCIGGDELLAECLKDRYFDESDNYFSIASLSPTCSVPETPVLTDPGVSINKLEVFIVKWTGVNGATKYQVQRDTNPNFSDPYPIPPDSEQNWRTDSPEITTTYYYRVKACNDCGCSSWSNIVDMQVIVPSITVTSPNGGEKWVVGNTYEITWTAVGVDKVTLRVNYGGGYLGLGATIPSTGVDAALGKFAWQIDPNAPYVPGDNLKIKITNDSDSTIYDESDGYFSIIQQP